MLNFSNFIQVYVFATNHHLKMLLLGIIHVKGKIYAANLFFGGWEREGYQVIKESVSFRQ